MVVVITAVYLSVSQSSQRTPVDIATQPRCASGGRHDHRMLPSAGEREGHLTPQ